MCCKLIAFVQRTLTETGKGSGNKVALHILCLFQCLVDFYTHCSKAPFLSGVYNMQLNDRKFPVYCDQASDGGGWCNVMSIMMVTPLYG